MRRCVSKSALLIGILASSMMGYADGVVLESYGRDGTDSGRYSREAAKYMRSHIKRLFTAPNEQRTYKECSVTLGKKDDCYHLKISKPLGEELDLLVAADSDCAPTNYKGKKLATAQKLTTSATGKELQLTGHRLIWKEKNILEFDLWGSNHKVGGYTQDLLKMTWDRKTDELTSLGVESTHYHKGLLGTRVRHSKINCDEY